MIETIKKSFISWLIFIWTVLIWSYVYASTVSSWQTLTADLFNEKTVPSKAVMAFYDTVCPIWWSYADWTNWNPDLRWEFIRWLDNWRWVDTSRSLWTWQNATRVVKRYWWSWGWQWDVPDIMNYAASDYEDAQIVHQSTNVNYPWSVNNQPSHTKYVEAMRVRPRNVALLYCIKD